MDGILYIIFIVLFLIIKGTYFIVRRTWGGSVPLIDRYTKPNGFLRGSPFWESFYGRSAPVSLVMHARHPTDFAVS